jgi:hypothetical protein
MDTSFLKGLVPLIGNALGGPLGGAAAAFVAEKMGISNKTVEGISSALTEGKLNPEQISQLKLAELDFKKFLEQNKIDLEKIHADNTKSAREMQAASKSKTPEILSFVITVGFFGVLSYMLTMEAKPGESLLIMLGALGTSWAAVVNFWFGSTAGSSRKTELLSQAPAITSDTAK